MTSKNNKKIILILPAYNEEKKISKVIQGADYNLIDEVLVVDDGSTDNTYQKVNNYRAKVIRHPYNLGVGAAIRTGINYALENNFEVIVVMGADAQDRHLEMPFLLEPILNEDFDFVQGSRYLEGTRIINAPLFRKITTKLYSFIFKLLTGFPSTDATNGFRAMKTGIFTDSRINLNQEWLNRYELEPYILYKAIKLKYKVKEVAVTKIYHSKNIGYTKMKPIISWWSIIRPIFLLSLGIKK